MYCVYVESGSSLLIESTDSMAIIAIVRPEIAKRQKKLAYIYIAIIQVWMTILESGWNLWVRLVGVVSRRWVWLVGGIYGYGYNV